MLSDKERLALKDKEVQLFNGRVLFVGVMVFLMVLLLVDRLYSLQVTQHATFATLSEEINKKLFFEPLRVIHVNEIADEQLREHTQIGLMELMMKHIYMQDPYAILQLWGDV